ncbi:MAG: WXG100 family type VII secretion target [Chloroflexota bacterium]
MPDVRMNYSSMEAMQKAFHNAHNQIEDTMREMEKIAKTMEDGGLVGMAGDTYREAIRTKLMKRMKALAEKMREMEGDIHGAVIATRDGVSTAQSRFK